MFHLDVPSDVDGALTKILGVHPFFRTMSMQVFNDTFYQKGFLDHETRISPAVASQRRGTGARLRRDSEDETQHTVWTQDDSVEWNILSRLGLSAKQLASRIGDDADDDEGDYGHNFVHRDDYLEGKLPCLQFLDPYWTRILDRTSMANA